MVVASQNRGRSPASPWRGSRFPERELNVTAATISLWRDHFLAGGQSSLKSREADDRDEEIRRLRAKVGEQAMEIELLYERARRAEGRDPFAPRRSRP
jgi:hypothetical protein